MNDDQILNRLTTIFDRIFDDDIVLTSKTSAADIADWDSLTHVRLILSVEKAFDVKFSAAEVANFKNVGDLVSLIAVRA